MTHSRYRPPWCHPDDWREVLEERERLAASLHEKADGAPADWLALMEQLIVDGTTSHASQLTYRRYKPT